MWNFLYTVFLLVPLRNVLFRFAVRAIAKGGKGASHLEIERKFFLGDRDLAQVRAAISEAKFNFWCQSEINDWFLPTHEKRELMRVRRERIDSHAVNTLTIKRWVNTTSGGTEREETERTIGPVMVAVLLFIGRILKGSSLLSLRKRRNVYRGLLGARNAIISLDDARDLGKYSGSYLEIEVLADQSEDISNVENSILELATRVTGGAQVVKQSYRELFELSRK
jgi:predicted adenylyl cyclase CyaB